VRSNITVQQFPVLKYLSKDQIEEIHFSTLEILERTGVEVFNDEALGLLKVSEECISNCSIKDNHGKQRWRKMYVSGTPSELFWYGFKPSIYN